MSRLFLTAIVVIGFNTFNANAQEALQPAKSDAAELAKKLANPVASLISVPFQNNTDLGIGVDNGYKNTLNFQPFYSQA